MFRNERKDNYDHSEENVKAQQSVLEIEEVSVHVEEEVPRYPLKTLISSLVLFITGSALLIAGLVDEFVGNDASKGMAMWIVGAITFIPGFYYTFLFFKVLRAKTTSEKLKILREIPEM